MSYHVESRKSGAVVARRESRLRAVETNVPGGMLLREMLGAPWVRPVRLKTCGEELGPRHCVRRT